MRRSGSSSCMLRPKEECTVDDADVSLSVTLLNREQLPNYSVERFYMLSEIDHHVHSTQFQCDLDTTESLDAPSSIQENFPPYCILYLLWRHDMTSSPKKFVEEVVCKALEKLQTLVNIEPSYVSASSTPSHSPRASEADVTSLEKKTRVYLVIDRCAPDQQQFDTTALTSKELEDVRSRRHQVQVEMAEKLARTVATNSLTRALCDGMTIGVADHIRAAPGLEACMNAISLGAGDRRRASIANSKVFPKSYVGILASAPCDLLGLQGAETEPDAAEGVLQCRICAEWSGRGNWHSFASRAHSQWRMEHHLLVDKDGFKRNRGFDLNELSCDKLTPVDFLSSTMACLFWIGVLVYLFHNYGDSFFTRRS